MDDGSDTLSPSAFSLFSRTSFTFSYSLSTFLTSDGLFPQEGSQVQKIGTKLLPTSVWVEKPKLFPILLFRFRKMCLCPSFWVGGSEILLSKMFVWVRDWITSCSWTGSAREHTERPHVRVAPRIPRIHKEEVNSRGFICSVIAYPNTWTHWLITRGLVLPLHSAKITTTTRPYVCLFRLKLKMDVWEY